MANLPNTTADPAYQRTLLFSDSAPRTGFVPSANGSTSSSRDEMNLAEFPLAVLSTRADPRVKTLEFSDCQRLKTGEVLERKWLITAADKFGLPTATDDDVVLGLIRLTMDQGFRDRKVYFTRYELLRKLRWSTEGRSYSRINKSLDRLSGVRIRATNAFYDNVSKTYQTCNFGIIDAYEIVGERGNKAPSPEDKPRSFFIWSEALFDSFRAGFIKKLDLDLYFSLKSAVSRRLYRYLDKHFYYRTCVERPLLTLAFEKLGLSRNYKYVSSVRQQIEPAAEELVEVGFLDSFEFAGKGSQTVARFRRAQAQLSEAAPAAATHHLAAAHEQPGKSALEAKRIEIMEALMSRGISLSQARRLVSSKSEEQCAMLDDIIQYYDFLVERRDRKVSRNRIGFLYRAVEAPERFTVPPGFAQGGKESALRECKTAGSSGPARPELRLFSGRNRSKPVSARGENAPEEELRLRYRAFLDREIAGRTSSIDAGRIEMIHSLVETRMSCLKSVLSPDKFRYALESCVRDEIARTLKLPDFEKWCLGEAESPQKTHGRGGASQHERGVQGKKDYM